MPQITFVAHDGSIRHVDTAVGMTVMRAAVSNDVPGIEAVCGGSCACGTCHVIVDPDWAGRLLPPQPEEEDTLDVVAKLEPGSRLSCQIVVTPALDGLVVRTPESQG